MTTELSPELLLAQAGVLQRLAQIEAKLKESDPMLPLHCETIRKALLDNEELVHILPDDKIRILMAGMKKYTNIQLIAEASKTRGKSKITVDDL